MKINTNFKHVEIVKLVMKINTIFNQIQIVNSNLTKLPKLNFEKFPESSR